MNNDIIHLSCCCCCSIVCLSQQLLQCGISESITWDVAKTTLTSQRHRRWHRFYNNRVATMSQWQRQSHKDDNSVTIVTTMSQWQQCHNDNNVTMTTMSQWRQCHNDDNVRMMTMSQWQQCHNDNIVTMTTMSQWQQCHNDDGIVTMTVVLSQWRWYIYICDNDDNNNVGNVTMKTTMSHWRRQWNSGDNIV